MSLLFRHSVVSNSLQPHGLQHTRLPCPSPTPRACSNSCPVSLMSSNHLFLCHPLLFLPSVFPSIRVFSSESALRIRWPKYWSFSIVFPMNIQGWFLLGLTGFIFFQSKGLTFKSSPVPQFESINSSALSLLYGPTLSSVHEITKYHPLNYFFLIKKIILETKKKNEASNIKASSDFTAQKEKLTLGVFPASLVL